MVGTGGLVLQFRDRTVDAAESELGNTAQLLSRHFDQQLVVLQRIHDEVSAYAQAEGIDTDQKGWELRVKVMELHHSQNTRDLRHRVRRGQIGRILQDGSAGDFPFGYESYFLDAVDI